MSARPWRTNGLQLFESFASRYALASEDIRLLLEFVCRLEIDPFDVVATRDHVGEHYCRIGPSATHVGRVLAVGYRIDAPRRSVEVISFSLAPA